MVHVFLHADKGIFPFIARLVLYPGIMAREYINGKRRIFNPFQYLLISVGVVLFLMTQSNFYETLDSYNNQNASRFPNYFKKAMSDFNWFIKNYANVITFLTLPLYALFSWLFFRKRPENYAEHFTMMVFSMCQVNTVNALLLIMYILFNLVSLGIVTTVSILLIIIAFCITYKQFYKLKWNTALWKAIIVYTTSYITHILIIGVALMVYILMLKAGSKNYPYFQPNYFA